MSKNVGTADKIVRIVLGLALAGWGVATHNWLGAIAIVPLGTALLGFCPLYPIVGINTAGKS